MLFPLLFQMALISEPWCVFGLGSQWKLYRDLKYLRFSLQRQKNCRCVCCVCLWAAQRAGGRSGAGAHCPANMARSNYYNQIYQCGQKNLNLKDFSLLCIKSMSMYYITFLPGLFLLESRSLANFCGTLVGYFMLALHGMRITSASL